MAVYQRQIFQEQDEKLSNESFKKLALENKDSIVKAILDNFELGIDFETLKEMGKFEDFDTKDDLELDIRSKLGNVSWADLTDSSAYSIDPNEILENDNAPIDNLKDLYILYFRKYYDLDTDE